MSEEKPKVEVPSKAGKRPFRATTVDSQLEKQRSMSKADWKVLTLVLAIATVVRVYGLAWPSSVVFDEVHFGKFAKKYIIGRFFFDVHPPLAKMLFGMFAFLGGFDPDSDFDFDNIGDDYMAPRVPYVVMRLFPTLAGLGTIGLCYSTMRASGVRTYIAAITALLLTFENTFATESRYILLDSPLVFFMAIAVYGFKRFENAVPFSLHWYKYLLLTGLGIGAEVSSKWVGLFTIGWLGSITAYQMWWIWGDLNVNVRNFMKHFWSRIFFFLVVPALCYIGMFYLHFLCVDNMGGGAELLPRWFQASLKHNDLPIDVPLNVTYGSVVTLRHVNTNGGWLHSHPYYYPQGSQQQQVTLYPFDDVNNHWIIENGTEIADPELLHEVRDGDIIRLKHVMTDMRLHSHDHRAPLTTHDYVCEVSAYGAKDFPGDYNDNWRVKVVKTESKNPEDKDKLQALRTYFQLEHVMDNCKLYSRDVTLPEWGFGQQEVACIRDGKGPKTVWFIEYNENPRFPEDIPRVNYEVPSFFAKFIALHKVMWDINKGLTETHHWESRPLSWVTLKRGINMWGQHNRQVYLTGNLPIYWTILAGVVLLAVYKVVRILYWQMGEDVSYLPKAGTDIALFDKQFGYYALGWWFHLFPSFFMDRQLFLHHYLASLYFGILMVGQLLELVVSRVKSRKLANFIPLGYLSIVVTWYLWFSPLIYGTPWTKQMCEMSKYLDMDFDCGRFLENYGDYAAQNKEIKESQYSAYHQLNPPEVTESERTDEEIVNSPEQAQMFDGDLMGGVKGVETPVANGNNNNHANMINVPEGVEVDSEGRPVNWGQDGALEESTPESLSPAEEEKLYYQKQLDYQQQYIQRQAPEELPRSVLKNVDEKVVIVDGKEVIHRDLEYEVFKGGQVQLVREHVEIIQNEETPADQADNIQEPNAIDGPEEVHEDANQAPEEVIKKIPEDIPYGIPEGAHGIHTIGGQEDQAQA